jgi:hypothetical protein
MLTTQLPGRKKSLRYITSNGKKQAVILDLDQLQHIERRIEDLQDALAYERAKRQATGFITLENFKKELKRIGKL